MSTYTQILYHIVFSTKNREPVLDPAWRRQLYLYIWGIIKKHRCHLYRLGGINDHIHILSDLHPSVALADYVKGIKIASHEWIKTEGHMASFPGWQEGYGGFTHNIHEKERLINYIKGQDKHHERVSFRDELLALLREAGIEFDEKYLD